MKHEVIKNLIINLCLYAQMTLVLLIHLNVKIELFYSTFTVIHSRKRISIIFLFTDVHMVGKENSVTSAYRIQDVNTAGATGRHGNVFVI